MRGGSGANAGHLRSNYARVEKPLVFEYESSVLRVGPIPSGRELQREESNLRRTG